MDIKELKKKMSTASFRSNVRWRADLEHVDDRLVDDTIYAVLAEIDEIVEWQDILDGLDRKAKKL